jgi:hypothetical protein
MYKHIGKKVEDAELRVNNDFYLEKSKATAVGKMNTAQVTAEGKIVSSSAAISLVTLSDADGNISAGDIEAGILTITPTATRTKTLPNAEELGDILGFTDFYQFADIVLVNLSGSQRVIVAPGGSSTLTGYNTVAANSSGLFRIISDAGGDGTVIVRIA